ncbi:MAG: hypothetical protein WC244_04525 [Patescibacteria group bacterium]|jgi:hypothetical protein
MKKFDSNFESKKKLRDSTLVFLIKKSQEKVTEICLAMKKRGFGMNRWNGVGGQTMSFGFQKFCLGN